ncbi:hypothetical protein RRF57_012630 [Xylaria bambusicola]|uniref:Uncharacterized protein n=1 Tax=Xylaria bambusicola TaxID=326684 RepID=A0AAN7UZS5_9PEZI
MLKARKHRDQELERLRHDPVAAQQLEIDDRTIPVPLTAGTISANDVADIFRQKWRRLVNMSEMPNDLSQIEKQTSQPFEPAHVPLKPLDPEQSKTARAIAQTQNTCPSTNDATMYESSIHYTAPKTLPFDQSLSNVLQFNAFSEPTIDWSNGHPESGELLGWFWADADPGADVFGDINMDPMDFNIDLDGAVDWHNWVESAKVIEMDAQDAQGRANKQST